MKLDGKKALVTGGAVRIGRAICEALSRCGAEVVVHYRRSADEAQALCEQLARAGGRAWAVAADLAAEEECAGLIDKARWAAGGLDILVNNAAIFERDSLADFSVPGAAAQLAANFFAPVILMRRFAETTASGRIVNLLDRRITGCDPEHLTYTVSKKALAHATLAAAREWAPRITVNAVAPGAVLPPPGRDESYLKEKAGPIPLGRPCAPGEIADAVLFLLASDAITGQILFVDGGQHLLAGELDHGG